MKHLNKEPHQTKHHFGLIYPACLNSFISFV